MTTAIQSTHTGLLDVISIYGFGSYFRGEPYRDVDIVMVLDCDIDTILDSVLVNEQKLLQVAVDLGVKLHITSVTVAELIERPFRDMHTLKLLSGSSVL